MGVPFTIMPVEPVVATGLKALGRKTTVIPGLRNRVISFFTPDAVYHNMPLDPVQGTEAIHGLIQTFAGMAKEIDWTVHQIAETSGGVVLTERTDRFLVGEIWIALPVMGSFELRDGKISAWRDYFDLNQFNQQLPK